MTNNFLLQYNFDILCPRKFHKTCIGQPIQINLRNNSFSVWRYCSVITYTVRIQAHPLWDICHMATFWIFTQYLLNVKMLNCYKNYTLSLIWFTSLSQDVETASLTARKFIIFQFSENLQSKIWYWTSTALLS